MIRLVLAWTGSGYVIEQYVTTGDYVLVRLPLRQFLLPLGAHVECLYGRMARRKGGGSARLGFDLRNTQVHIRGVRNQDYRAERELVRLYPRNTTMRLTWTLIDTADQYR